MDGWRRFQRHWLWFEELGFGLDTSRIGLPDNWEVRHRKKIGKILEAMACLEVGEPVNETENRAVGHYWLRAPELAPTEELGQKVRNAQEHIRTFAGGVLSGEIGPEDGKFTQLLSIGIGGSALGPQLLVSALAKAKPILFPHFLDNTDPTGFQKILDRIGRENLRHTLILVTSKSGSTPEPCNALNYVRPVLENLGLKFADHAVAVTCEGSKLDQLARKEDWLARFPMWDWVGGRTSVTSPVGLLPAALCSIDIDELLRGAAAMDRLTRQRTANPALQLAWSWYSATGGKGKRSMVILPYADSLELLSRYLQQLIMESLGKRCNRRGRVVKQGITVYGNKGSTDQHAYVQQLRDGLNNFFVTFIEVLSDGKEKSLAGRAHRTAAKYLEGFLLGTRAALGEEKRPSITITLREVNPFSMGMIIALYERTVGFYAELINVNAYDQPGVEAGKKAADQLLKLVEEVENWLKVHGISPSDARADDIAAALNRRNGTEMIFKWLEFLRARA